MCGGSGCQCAGVVPLTMQRYSVDLRNKHEDAVIPLSAVEADAVFDATPEKGASCVLVLDQNSNFSSATFQRIIMKQHNCFIKTFSIL